MMDVDLAFLVDEPDAQRSRLANALTDEERNEFGFHWRLFARPEQLPPKGDWRIWLVMAGRGFGKTRCGSEWVRMIAEREPDARIALVGASLSESRSVMIEGESGLLACSPPERRPVFEPSLKRLRYSNGAQVHLYSAQDPEALRGPQHSHAWCDEIGKWPLAGERSTRCWDNLLMGLRLGRLPRVAVTTTPRAVPLVQRLLKQQADGTLVLSRGSTTDNADNLPRRFLESMETEFGSTQLARQEIQGELLTDISGALWTRSMIEESRETQEVPTALRVVVAVDPPVSATGDECGVIVAQLGGDGIARIVADCSIGSATPAQWADAVATAAKHWKADRVIAEANQGGAMVESVLRAASAALPVKLVHASRGKVARAEPVAALYSAGRVRHCGSFPKLEDQLCGLMIGGGYAGPTRSPDRADALVWALSELMLGASAIPSVRTL